MKKQRKQLIHRLKRIHGQINGLIRMVEHDQYCIDIITQTSAVRNALKGAEDVLLRDHLSSCVIDQVKTGKKKKAIEEILKVYTLKK